VTQPSVVFIDDSATMREVIKIAFRRENIEVAAFSDAVSALTAIEKAPPDVIITDVLMPDRDGYEVCQQVKQHPTLAATPVILMSGVVNKTVADRAFAVKAAELIRKPFQPQDLISRVRRLLHPKDAPPVAPSAPSSAAALSSIFSAPQVQRKVAGPALVTATAPAAARVEVPAPSPTFSLSPQPRVMEVAVPRMVEVAQNAAIGSGDISKLKLEIIRLEGLAKKLQSELTAEREYSQALEEHIKTLQEAR
jgi:CheY-like chemotaxis protein